MTVHVSMDKSNEIVDLIAEGIARAIASAYGEERLTGFEAAHFIREEGERITDRLGGNDHGG